MTTDAFTAYNLYSSLRLHFTSDKYNFFKYNGKTNIKKENFELRKDKYQYYKLGRMYDYDELKDFLVANFSDRTIKFVGELFQDEAKDCYEKWKKTQQSLSYIFGNDIEEIFTRGLKSTTIYLMLQRGEITKETVCILDELIDIISTWDNVIDDFLYPETRMRLEKYKPFLNIDILRYKKILVDKKNIFVH